MSAKTNISVEIGEGSYVDPTAQIGVYVPGADKAVRIGRGSIIRSNTVIYAGVTAGENFKTGHGTLIREDNLFGDDCSVGSNATIEPGNRIGNRCRVHSGCFLEHVKLGDDVFVGPGVVFADDPHPACPRYLECVLGATVEDRVSIGANATILPGVRIGHDSLIGGGAVVTGNVPPKSVVVGNPARVVKNIGELRCWPGYFTVPYEWREKNRPG